MGLRINTNISELTALTNLHQTDRQLSGSLRRLSTELRITRASDDPRGLVISEQLRAQIGSTKQAVENTEFSSNLIGSSVSEAALTEVSDLLIDIRESAIFAKNTGGISPEQIEAEQDAVDSAINFVESPSEGARHQAVSNLPTNFNPLAALETPQAKMTQFRALGENAPESGGLPTDPASQMDGLVNKMRDTNTQMLDLQATVQQTSATELISRLANTTRVPGPNLRNEDSDFISLDGVSGGLGGTYSEQFRAQIGITNQAVENMQSDSELIGTAEAALQEQPSGKELGLRAEEFGTDDFISMDGVKGELGGLGGTYSEQFRAQIGITNQAVENMQFDSELIGTAEAAPDSAIGAITGNPSDRIAVTTRFGQQTLPIGSEQFVTGRPSGINSAQPDATDTSRARDLGDRPAPRERADRPRPPGPQPDPRVLQAFQGPGSANSGGRLNFLA